MNIAKENFIQNKALLEWTISVLGNPNFNSLMVSAQAQFMASMPSREQTQGAQRFIDVLCSLPDPEAAEMEPLVAGIDHRMEIPDRERSPKKSDNK